MKRIEDFDFQVWDRNPIWNTLTADEKQDVKREVEIFSYHKNEIIFREGEIPTHVFLLISGKVRLLKEGISNRPQLIRFVKPDDFFGYRAVISGDFRNSTANAFEASVISRLPKEVFLRIIQGNGQFCYEMMVLMARNLAASESQTVNLTQKHIRGRLAESILCLRKNYGMEDDNLTIAMHLSREDLANMSNMTTSNAIRTLSQFAQEGLVSVDGRSIRILNEDALHRISRLG